MAIRTLKYFTSLPSFGSGRLATGKRYNYFNSMKSLSRSQLYWVFQLCGWGLYGLVVSVWSTIYYKNTLSVRELLSIVFMCVFAILYTHQFRKIIKKWKWTSLPTDRLVGQVLLAIVAMAILHSVSNYAAERLLGLSGNVVVSAGVIIMLIINSSLLFLLWSLIYFVTFFFSNYKKEEIERLRWEGAIKDFELNKLKSQLNPHFVFNALNTIRALVDEDPQKAQTSITQLSNILRNSLLADRNKTITLEEELRTVNDYLQLEKIRYEERLQVHLDIAPNTLKIQVPPMMIQTLVENAVKHGIQKKLNGGFIAIYSMIEGDKLMVRIKNTGLLARLDSGGFGILNTRQRLELLYGGQDHFEIMQEDSDIVNANLKIPIQ
jgi:two-component system, LytTR family, sensor kinase